MKFKTNIIAIACLMGNFALFSQEKSNVQFGKITKADFDLPRTKVIDSNTSAVILSDIGSTGFIGNAKGWFTLVFTRHTRIKIINKNAFNLATVRIGLYVRDGDEEKLENLKASTFNLENGTVVETKLGKKDLFEDKIDKHHTYKKFTLPAVMEGSILEYSYVIKSDFDFNLRPWEFQSVQYPCLWSEYQVNIPSLMIYVFLPQGFDPFYIKTTEVGQENYRITQPSESYSLTNQERVFSVNANTNKYRWVMKDVPPLMEENFTSTGRNFIDKIEFQEAKISDDGVNYKNVMNDWTKATEDLLKREDFGYAISQDNYWVKDALTALKIGGAERLEQAKRIYYYLEENVTCNNYYNYFIETSLRDVFKKRTGNVGELNLLLIAMLREQGFDANPVLLSTKDYGLNYEPYPLLDRFNYLICKLNVGGKVIYLDASHPRLGFGCLPADCYNGHARIISDKNPGSVYFYADSIKEKKLTTVIIINEGKGVWGGSYQTNLGYMQSYDLREKVAKESENVFFKEVQTTLGPDLRIDNSGIDSLNQLENPIKMHFDFTYNREGAPEFIYFYPMIAATNENQNPFKAMDRKYPVEMSYPVDETYILNLDVPDGYNVEEIPKSTKVTFNSTEGFFEYLVQNDEGHIQLRSRIKLNRTSYTPDEYKILRDFFAIIVKKQNEQMVFKKKK